MPIMRSNPGFELLFAYYDAEANQTIIYKDGALLTRQQYLDLVASLDNFYDSISDQEIEQHNHKLLAAHQTPIAQPQARTSKPGYIYLIKSGDYYKIGKTNNYSRRKKEFGLHLPFPFEEMHIFRVKDMEQRESWLHAKFQEKHTNGEWFKLSPEDVAWFCTLTDEV